MEYLKIVLPIVGTVVAAILAYLLNQRAERRSRAEQYQLEQIDALLRNIIENDQLHQTSAAQEEIRKVTLESSKALALIPVYGSPEVQRIHAAFAKTRASHDQVEALVSALQQQGKYLIRPKKWFALR